MRFRDVLRAELDRRRAMHATYSLRRFARVLGVHHSTLSRLLAQQGPVAGRVIRKIGGRLRLPVTELDRLSAAEAEEAILSAVDRPQFRPDTRWLASASGIPIDQVNIVLQALMRTGRLRMVSAARWERSRPTT